MEKQRVARQAALVKQLECGCPDSTCADGKSCSHPMRRITSAKDVASPLPSSSSNSRPPSSSDNNNQVSSTTGTSMILNNNSPRVYSRESRNNCSSSSGNTPPLVLSLSQIQGGGGLLILNSSNSSSPNTSQQNLVTPVSVGSFVRAKNEPRNGHLVLKQEVMDTNPSSCCHPSKDHKKMGTENRFDGMTYNRHQEVVMSSAPSTPSKHMDTSHEEDYKHQNFGETVVLLGTDSSKSDGSSIINGGFFNETLDLSQEDIQRTLSANMPLCSSELEQRHNSESTTSSHQSKQNEPQNMTQEINPMDFIDSCDVVVSPTHVVDDDVFVNLDAFDMLGEFPDLEGALLDVNPSGNRQEKTHSEHTTTHTGNSMEGSAKITDYSPEWAYPEGGVKVLVTGPWHSSGPYTVLFDTFPVPTTLVQSGVLRCYCPGECGFLLGDVIVIFFFWILAHEAGLATLQVACDGYVISNSVIFEYKLPPREEQVAAPEPKIERSNDNLLKFTLLQRLEAMDDRLQIKQEPTDGDCVRFFLLMILLILSKKVRTKSR